MSEDVSDNNDSLEQSQPNILLKLRKDPNPKLQRMNDTRYCDTCTPIGCVCTKDIRPKDLSDEWSDNDKEEDEYCENCTHMGHRCACKRPDDSDWAPHNQHLFDPQITDDEKEEAPPAESDWNTDIDQALDYHARPPMLMRRPKQQPKVVTFQPRRCPAGWPKGVRPEVPPKPDCLKNKFIAHVNEKEGECRFLELVQHYVYEEPREE